MIPLRRTLTPKNVLIDLLRITRDQSVTTRSLIETGELFGFNSNAIRVALTRMVSKGILESDERGYYRLSPSAHPMSDLIDSWREGEARRKPWKGQWILCHLPKSPQRSMRNRSLKALKFVGFQEDMGNLWVRPDNLTLNLEQLRARLDLLGLEEQARLLQINQVEQKTSAHWETLWNPQKLNEGYRESLAKIKHSANKLKKMPFRDAMIESFLIGGEAIHILVKDPLLPEEMQPCTDRANLHAAMLEYDQLGRSIWGKHPLEIKPVSAVTSRGHDNPQLKIV